MHINLNTGTAPEILLIPRVGKRMTASSEYGRWVAMAQFTRRLARYVDAAELDRLKRYSSSRSIFNAATDEQFKTIPNLGGNMLREFKEYRPWKTKRSSTRRLASTARDGTALAFHGDQVRSFATS